MIKYDIVSGMLTIHDLIRIPYTPDMTLAGIAYACRSLAYTYDRMGGDPGNRLRRIAAGKAVELVFKRYLQQQAVPLLPGCLILQYLEKFRQFT